VEQAGVLPTGAIIKVPVPKLRKRSFLIGRNERNVSADNHHDSAEEFLNKMDLGLFDGKFNEEIRKLSRTQLEEVAEILNKRSVSPEKPE
jgi:hypothetical protein